jgi:hypothetical protein
MDAVEIEGTVSELFTLRFDAEQFPFQFLDAFGNKGATIEKLKKGVSNLSDVQIADRFGNPVTPLEWYWVALPTVDAFVEKLKDGSIHDFAYDPENARIIPLH